MEREQAERPDPDFSLIQNALQAAADDPELRARMQADPAATFAEMGMLIPEGTAEEFNAMFRERTAPAFSMMGEGVGDLMMAWPSAGCTACTISAWTVAGLIVAVGAGALATLSATSAPVVALAAWAGVSNAAALAFIGSLAATIGGGVTAVARAICEWVGAC